MRVGIKPEGRAPAREGTEIRSADGRADRQGHIRRLRAERRRADRDGLRRKRHSPRPARRSSSSCAASRLPAQVVALPFVPHNTLLAHDPQHRFRKDHAQDEGSHDHDATPKTTNGSASTAMSRPSASPSMRRIAARRHRLSSSCRRSAARSSKGGEAAVVELVKAASDVYAPASGEVVAVNDALEARPATINEDARGQGLVLPAEARRAPEQVERADDRRAVQGIPRHARMTRNGLLRA